MDYLNEINTINERDLLLSEIESYKRKDLNSVRKNFLDVVATVDVDELYKKLKKIEVVKIILAIEPTIGILKDVRSFFDENLGEKVLFDFEIDSQMFAGIKIVYKGKYYDYSV